MSDADRVADELEGGADAAFATDESGCVVACNDAAERLLGAEPGSLVGRSCHEVLSGIDTFGDRFCRPACALREVAARSRRPVRGFDLQVRQSSGELLRVDLTYLAIRDADSRRYTLVHRLRPSEREGSEDLEAMRARRSDGVRPSTVPEPAEAATADSRPLSAREVQLLRLLAQGRSPQALAEELGISLHTVRTHLRNVHRKLGVHSVTHAVTLALRRGLI